MVNPTGFTFNNSGNKIFTSGDDNKLYELDVAAPFSITPTSISYNSVNFDRLEYMNSTYLGNYARDLEINSLGSRLYTVNDFGIHQYDMSANDMSTLSFENTAQWMPGARDVFLTPDGKKLFRLGSAGQNLWRYDLDIPYKISTARYISSTATDVFRDYARGGNKTTIAYPSAFTFSNDGLKLYLITPRSGVNIKIGKLYQWDLQTPFDPDSFSLKTTVDHWIINSSPTPELSQTRTAGHEGPVQIKISPTGDKLYILNEHNKTFMQFLFTNNYEITSLPQLYQYNADYLMLLPTNDMYGLSFKHDGTSFFVSNLDSEIYQYNIPAWEISTATLANTFTSVPNLTSRSFLVDFAENGDKMYTLINDGTYTGIYEMDLDPAYDVSTAVDAYTSKFISLSPYETNPTGISLNSDDTKLFVIGQTSNKVHEFSLADSGEISSASYIGSFDISSEITSATSLEIAGDDSKFFITNSSNIYQYTLGQDSIGSSIYDNVVYSTISAGGAITSITGMRFDPSGNHFYTIGTGATAIDKYSTDNQFQVIPL
jgi:hypothetical protein